MNRNRRSNNRWRDLSFPRFLVRARGLTEELRTWCQSETRYDKEVVVGEVGMDLIAGQMRLVSPCSTF
jgi:hypothetical protein